jgi:tRNA/tmRNA/rRNA uracil-C5-methylase (TrmA/RlmC/RlmD family)
MRHLPPGDLLPLAYVHVAGAQATLILKARDLDDRLLAPLLDRVAETGIEGLWLHLHPAAGRRLFARSGWRLLWGAAESVDHRGLLHGPTAFMQPLPGPYAAAIDEARRHLAPGASVPVLDLYCGIGATLREWDRAGSPALGVELSGEAVGCAIRNAPAAAILRGTCAQRLPQIREWWRHVGGEGVAFVNPPRSGLEPEVTQALAADLRPARTAYLSCSAGTLARDLTTFEAAGFVVQSVRPYDFFPNTHHVEALALVERR